MKLALAQINFKVADIVGNEKKIVNAIREAKTLHADLVLFSELSLVGYPPRDLLDFAPLIDANLAALNRLIAETKGITAIVGFVERNPSATGKRYFNSAAILVDGKWVATYRKNLLPYYDVFEEERYFESGNSPVFEFSISKKRIAVTICEDIWNRNEFLSRQHPKSLIGKEMKGKWDLVVNLSASPFQLGKPETRTKLVQSWANDLNTSVALCNQVGGNDELLFDGGSFLISANGDVKARAKYWSEDLIVADLDDKTTTISDSPKESSEWISYALETGIRDYVAKTNGKGVCLGLSGGIDSSVVAAIAVRALGPQKVHALALPSRYSAEASEDDARILATRLGIVFHSLSIEKIFQATDDTWKTTFGVPLNGLTKENVQPRVRMTILMAYANEKNLYLLNTSNKSEISAGYATLYGDSAGALSVLGDLTKHQVYDLANWLNRENGGELIPKRIIERAPSAELRENQTDQDSLPPYPVLDSLVEKVVERGEPLSSLTGSFRKTDLDTFQRLHRVSEYKRRQLPPVLRISSHAFGMGRRIPVTAEPWF